MRRSLLAAALLALVSTVPVMPATAADATVGVIGFHGNAQLRTFPCALSPHGPGPCTGDLRGGWHGHATGQIRGGAYDVSWTKDTGLYAAFTYWEHQCVEPSTILGGANGTGSATAGPGHIFGTWQDGNGLPRAITDVRATFAFVWTRVATGALLTFDSMLVDLNVSGIGWVRASSSALPAAAVFVPLSVSEIHQPTCSKPVSVEGIVAGEVTLTS